MTYVITVVAAALLLGTCLGIVSKQVNELKDDFEYVRAKNSEAVSLIGEMSEAQDVLLSAISKGAQNLGDVLTRMDDSPHLAWHTEEPPQEGVEVLAASGRSVWIDMWINGKWETGGADKWIYVHDLVGGEE